MQSALKVCVLNPLDIAIEIKGVSHSFEGASGQSSPSSQELMALETTNLEIRRGELLSLIGPSGCGKSTLLNMMGGLLTPASGEVRVNGVQVSAPMPKTVSFVFQENALFPWNTILDNIVVALTFQCVPSSERLDLAHQALRAVGLSEFANYYPDQLSGGMRQRAALARALSLKTDIILMDEPFAALDEQTRMVLGEDLSTLLNQTGKTIVLVTHSLGEAVFLSDRIAVISARPGRVLEVIDVNEPHPRNPEFVTSLKFSELRNRLYELLHDEIRQTLSTQAMGTPTVGPHSSLASSRHG